MANLNKSSISSQSLSQDLQRASGVLQDMQSKGEFDPNLRGRPPAAFGAGGPMLKKFDASAVSSRKPSQAPTPPLSVKGIGNKVAKPDYSESKIVVAMVGLPARGKSYLSNKLMIYLKWLEYNVKVSLHAMVISTDTSYNARFSTLVNLDARGPGKRRNRAVSRKSTLRLGSVTITSLQMNHENALRVIALRC
jgi:hypothetical protein